VIVDIPFLLWLTTWVR